jgi:hypothetical protein
MSMGARWCGMGAAAAALGLGLAACSSSPTSPGVATVGAGPPASASATARTFAPEDRTAQLLHFAQCLRQHGLSIADPQPGAENVQLPAGTKSDPATQAALQSCQHLLGAGTKTGSDQAAQDRGLTLARCLRQHGLNVPDPQPGQPLHVTGAGDPRTQHAVAACQLQLNASSSASASAGQPS